MEHKMNLAKKSFAVVSSAVLAIAALVGPMAPLAHAAVHAAGTNVVSGNTVYFMDGTSRRPYTSAGAFLSYGFNSWASVVPASAEDMAVTQGAFVAPRDGSLILDQRDHRTVFLMTNGQTQGFATRAAFDGLGYKMTNVLEGDVSFVGTLAPITTAAMAHPVGTLVLDPTDHRTVYLMTTAGRMGIPSIEVFNSWGYSFNLVANGNSYDMAQPMNAGIMPARVAGQLNPPVNGTVVIPPVAGNVSVSAASDMPASTTVITNQSLADLGHFTFMGSGTVTSVNLKRVGVSADTSLSNVYLFDGATRLTDSASVTSGSNINFSNAAGLFTVSGSRTISVKADLNATAGETLGVRLDSAMTGSTAVSGTPVSGNLNTVAGATLASVSIASATGSGNTDPGTDINVWQGSVTVGTRDVIMTRLSLRQIGSIQSTDIHNFKLYADGVLVASQASLDANGYVTFSTSKALTSGTRVLKVTADVIGGSGRTVQMSLRGAYDLTVTDTQYNANPTVSGSFPFGPSAFTVNSGTLTTVKAVDSPSANLTVGASDVAVGKWTMTAYGEPVKVETLTVGIDTNGTDANNRFRNVRILVNGAQVGSTTSVAAVNSQATGTSFTTNFTVNPGSPATVEVRSDIYDDLSTNDIAAGTTTSAQFALVAGSSNGRPQVSLGSINVPTTTVVANTLTIASGSISVAQTSTYANQTVVVPATAYKIGSFVLSGNSTEAVNINTIYVGFTAGSTVTEQTDLSDLYVVYGGTQTPVKGTVSSTVLNGNSWSVNIPLAVNQTMQFDVYATLASSVSTNAIITTFAAAGITAQSGTTVYADSTSSNAVLDAGFTGQTITGGTGSITATVDASNPVSAIVDDSQSVTTAAFKFAAVNDSYTITDATFTIANATNVTSVNLKDGASVVATRPGATTVTFNGLNIAAAANANKVLTVELVLGSVGVGAGTSGASILTTLTSATARSSNGTSAAVTESDPAGNAIYVYKALPTVTSVGLPTTALVAGTNTIAKFTVAPNGGTISWNRMIFSLNKTSAPVIANGAAVTLWDAGTNTQIAGTADIIDTANAATCLATLLACRIRFIPTSEQQLSTSTTYILKANVTGTLVSTDYISTSIAAPSVYAAPDTYANVAASGSFAATYAGYGTSPSFIWSDVSAATHSTTTTDWDNDFKVRFLPLDSQTVTKP
jgi:hypothetical protein